MLTFGVTLILEYLLVFWICSRASGYGSKILSVRSFSFSFLPPSSSFFSLCNTPLLHPSAAPLFYTPLLRPLRPLYCPGRPPSGAWFISIAALAFPFCMVPHYFHHRLRFFPSALYMASPLRFLVYFHSRLLPSALYLVSLFWCPVYFRGRPFFFCMEPSIRSSSARFIYFHGR